MVTWFTGVFAFVVAQRLVELVIAKRNATYMRSLGGFEVGAEHYRYLVLMHVAFFVSLLAEVYGRGVADVVPSLVPFTMFVLAQAFRVWCLASLGKFWNTRIFVLPGSEPVVRGPYRFMRHPNYVVVAIELSTLPLAFGAPITAVLFSIWNALVLRVRIRVEEAALMDETDYGVKMIERARFVPRWWER